MLVLCFQYAYHIIINTCRASVRTVVDFWVANPSVDGFFCEATDITERQPFSSTDGCRLALRRICAGDCQDSPAFLKWRLTRGCKSCFLRNDSPALLFIYFLMRRTQKWACSFYEGAALMAEAIKGKNSLVEQKLIREEREALKSVALKNILTAVIWENRLTHFLI